MQRGNDKIKATPIVTDFSDAGVLHVKTCSTIVGGNETALEILNYPNDFKLSNRSLMSFCVSINTDGWAEILEIMGQSSPIQFSAVFLTHKGQYIELLCIAAMEVGASVLDLYLLKSAQNSIYLSESLQRLETYEAFFNTDLLDINIKDPSSKYLATSKLFDETFSLPRGHALGKYPEDIFPKKFADHVVSHDQGVLAGNEVVSQIDIVPYTGKHLLVQKFPIYNKDESSVGIGVFVVDVTAIKVSEQRHIDARNKYEDYYELSTDLLWEADENWFVRESNAAGTSNVARIQLEVGVNLFQELERHMEDLVEFEKFMDALLPNQAKTEIFDLKSGFRIKLSVKSVSIGCNQGDDVELYRGLISVLPVRNSI